MNLFSIAIKNVLHRPLQTALSFILLAFGVGMISLLMLLEVQLREEFDRNIKDIDMVLGAKGSPLQLILANVYHIDAPTGNIKLNEARKLMKHPFIEEAIPLAYGDNYQMWRIVGTEPSYPNHYGVQVADGKMWQQDFESVIGSTVAAESGLKIGDTFYSSHGLTDTTDVHTNKTFKVVGIFEESGSVIDQLILCNIPSIWGVHEHVETEEDDKPENEITAVLLKKKNALAIVTLPNMIKDSNMQIALPSIEINRLNQNFGLGMDTVRYVALFIMLLSFLSVFVSLYSSLRDRKYELALMRSMGISAPSLFILILIEGAVMVLLGLLAGLLLSRCGLWALSSMLENQFHFDIYQAVLLGNEVILIISTIFVGILASLLPAVEAVTINISKTLSDA